MNPAAVFTFLPAKRLSAVRSLVRGKPARPALPCNALLYVPGLTDGLLATPYTPRLFDAVAATDDWMFVQPLLSSSYGGYGTTTLHADTEELVALLRYLRAELHVARVVLVGHSTGCQNAVHLLRHGASDAVDMVRGIVLQAPVSDRQFAVTVPGVEELLPVATSLVL
jgi:pimeloyl-ACP methyl ester carboxylesterase